MFNFIKQNAKMLATNKISIYFLILTIMASTLSYIYFANEAIRTITKIEKVKDKNLSLNLEVSEMESRRLSIENNISMARAKLLGLVEVNNPIFIVRNSQKTTLSLKTD